MIETEENGFVESAINKIPIYTFVVYCLYHVEKEPIVKIAELFGVSKKCIIKRLTKAQVILTNYIQDTIIGGLKAGGISFRHEYPKIAKSLISLEQIKHSLHTARYHFAYSMQHLVIDYVKNVLQIEACQYRELAKEAYLKRKSIRKAKMSAFSTILQELIKTETLFRYDLDRLREEGILKTTVKLRTAESNSETTVHWATTSPNALLLAHADCDSSAGQFHSNSLLRLSKPWTDAPVSLDIEIKPHLFAIYGSPSGKYAILVYNAPNRLEIWDIPNRSLLGNVSFRGDTCRVHFSPDENHFFMFLKNNQWKQIKTSNGTIVKTGGIPPGVADSCGISAVHPSGEWIAIGLPSGVWIENIKTDQIRTIEVRIYTDLSPDTFPETDNVSNETESILGLQDSIRNNCRKRTDKLSCSSFFVRECVNSIAFYNQFLCCSSTNGVRAYPWNRILADDLRICPPTFYYLLTDPNEFAPNDMISGFCLVPTQNRLLFCLAEKLYSMNLSNGKVKSLLALPKAARIMGIAALGETTFALDVCPQFPDYDRKVKTRYLCIIDISSINSQNEKLNNH